MRTGIIILAGTAALWVAALAQSPSQQRWQAPSDAASRQNPLKDKPALAAGGKKIFSRTCATCHASGPGQKGPNLASAVVQADSDGALFWKITNGNTRTGMPSFSSLPEAQRWQLVLYIRSLGQDGEEDHAKKK